MTKQPYLPIEPTIEPGTFNGWTDKMRRCQDDGTHYRVLYTPDLYTKRTPFPSEVAEIARETYSVLHKATVADVYVRYLPCRGNGIGVHVLVLRHTSEGSAVYFRTCRGGGMDLLAHVMQGIPLWLPLGYEVTKGKDGKPDGWRASDASRPPIILTDYCGLRYVAHPFDPALDLSSLTLKGDELTKLGYIVL